MNWFKKLFHKEKAEATGHYIRTFVMNAGYTFRTNDETIEWYMRINRYKSMKHDYLRDVYTFTK